MRIDIAFCSHPGGRTYNEDSVRCLQRDGICAAVAADGLGGHGGGKIASSAVAGFISEAFMDNPQTDPAYIKNLFEDANFLVVESQTPAQKMKSTGVALFVKDGVALWGHVGDTRLYHFIDGRLITQTVDHSVSQMAVFAGEITQEQIRRHADRNRVLRAFGDDGGFKAEFSPVQTLCSGFHAFLLCTDGFWEGCWEAEMELDLAKSGSPDDWIQAMTQRIIDREPDDNFSAAAVFIKTGGYDHV